MTPLAGRSIVVTRPVAQAEGLASLIAQAGGKALRFPVLAIEPVDGEAIERVLSRLERFDLAVFISRNAVEHGLAQARRHGRWPDLPVAAIGGGTRQALEDEGIGDVTVPDGPADSEALLAHPRLNAVEGKRIIIFRGQGGREQLAATLRERGATVEYAECYRRIRPDTDAQPLVDAWLRGSVHAVTVSSGEGLANLAALLGERGRGLLTESPLFVPHSRVAEAARALRVRRVLTAGASDEDMLAALVAYFGGAG